MRREEYDGYIRRFNEQDPAAFDDYRSDDMHMQNGLLEFRRAPGDAGTTTRRIWPPFIEHLTVERFVSVEHTATVSPL